MHDHAEMLRRTYAAFNAREIETVLAQLQPDVDWPNGMEGGRVQGHAAVRDYWRRQFDLIDSQVEPLEVTTAPDGRVVVDVQQVVRGPAGELISDGRVQHVYTFKDGLIERMDIREGEEPE